MSYLKRELQISLAIASLIVNLYNTPITKKSPVKIKQTWIKWGVLQATFRPAKANGMLKESLI